MLAFCNAASALELSPDWSKRLLYASVNTYLSSAKQETESNCVAAMDVPVPNKIALLEKPTIPRMLCDY